MQGGGAHQVAQHEAFPLGIRASTTAPTRVATTRGRGAARFSTAGVGTAPTLGVAPGGGRKATIGGHKAQEGPAVSVALAVQGRRHHCTLTAGPAENQHGSLRRGEKSIGWAMARPAGTGRPGRRWRRACKRSSKRGSSRPRKKKYISFISCNGRPGPSPLPR